MTRFKTLGLIEGERDSVRTRRDLGGRREYSSRRTGGGHGGRTEDSTWRLKRDTVGGGSLIKGEWRELAWGEVAFNGVSRGTWLEERTFKRDSAGLVGTLKGTGGDSARRKETLQEEAH